MILGGSAEPLGSGGHFLMAGGGARAVATGMLTCIPACPTEVSFCPSDLWRRRCALISCIPEYFINSAGETEKILEGGDQLVVSECERGGEVAVCDGEHFHQHAIARGGVGQVCNGVNSFLSIYLVGGLVVNKICGVVSGTRSGGL